MDIKSKLVNFMANSDSTVVLYDDDLDARVTANKKLADDNAAKIANLEIKVGNLNTALTTLGAMTGIPISIPGTGSGTGSGSGSSSGIGTITTPTSTDISQIKADLYALKTLVTQHDTEIPIIEKTITKNINDLNTSFKAINEIIQRLNYWNGLLGLDNGGKSSTPSSGGDKPIGKPTSVVPPSWKGGGTGGLKPGSTNPFGFGGKDNNADGKPDAWDIDGDGKPDLFDTDGDGIPDAIDTDGDGKPDKSITGIDTNGDGKPDAWDIDGDGIPDVFDTDKDGIPDAIDTNKDGKPDA